MLRINKLKIKNEKPTEEYIKSTIIPEIKKLPEPLLSLGGYSVIDPNETIICMQKELVYVDLLNPFSNIKYLGSKNVTSCVVA